MLLSGFKVQDRHANRVSNNSCITFTREKMSALCKCPKLFQSVGASQVVVRAKSSYRRFVNKTAIVTGATKGIGFATAQRLAMEGAKVVICSRSKTHVDEAISQLHEMGLTNTHALVCNVGEKEDRQKLVDLALSSNENSSIDILVSNVANGKLTSLLDTKESTWDKIMAINIKSHLQLVQECLPHMKKAKKGAIVFVGSHSAISFQSSVGSYSVSKIGLMQLSKLVASQVAQYNIRSNCIAAGLIDTDLARPTMNNSEYLNNVGFFTSNLIPRIGKVEEVAGPIAFLCSDDASYITGETLFISGGARFNRI